MTDPAYTDSWLWIFLPTASTMLMSGPGSSITILTGYNFFAKQCFGGILGFSKWSINNDLNKALSKASDQIGQRTAFTRAKAAELYINLHKFISKIFA